MTRSATRLVVLVATAICLLAAVGALAFRGVVRHWGRGETSRQGRVIRRPAVAQAAAVGIENLAPSATVTVSAETEESAPAAEGVADGVPDQREWQVEHAAAPAWIRLDWDSSVVVAEVVLYDLTNPQDNILGGTLEFDDGTRIPVAPLPADGTPFHLSFPPRTIRSLTFRIDSAQGGETGLAEIMVMGSRAR
jgi:hypothetical protein